MARRKPLTDVQIRALPALPKGSKKPSPYPLGDGLLLQNEPVVGSTPCLRYIYRYYQKRLDGTIKQNELPLGTYGRGAGRLTKAEALQKLREFKEWRKNTGLHAHHQDWLKQNLPQPADHEMTLREVCDAWMASTSRQEKAPSTQQECRRHLENHVFTIISPDLPIKSLEWDSGGGTGGRQRVQKVREAIDARKSHDMANRVIRTLGQVCDFAIDKGWMQRGQNPCTVSADDRAKHVPKGNPTLAAEQVPEFMEALNNYAPNTFDLVVTALKMHLLLCTRPGALVAIEWSWIDESNSLIVIPGSTPGLKRPSDLRGYAHLIPISSGAFALLESLKHVNSSKEHIFFSSRGDKYPHITPSSLNNLIKANLGYKGIINPAGWRSVVQTVGQDILGYQWEVMDRQLGHLTHKQGVRGHYDNSELLDKRREFMEDWSNWCIKQGLRIP